jgi:hypothetical protein
MHSQLPRRMALIAAVAATALAGGCANLLEGVASTQNTRILNPDTVQGRRASRAGSPSYNPNDVAADRLRGQVPGTAPIPTSCAAKGDAYFTFFCQQTISEHDVTDPTKARQYLAAGLTLSNEVCDSWFNRLRVAQVTLDQTSDAISSAGAVTSAILGYTRADPEKIGLVASLFGAGKQGVDNVAANYIVAVDLTSVAAAVREYRALYAQEIEQPTATWNYYTARRVIMAYDNTCSALSVKRFVNIRVEGGSGDDQVSQLFDTAIAGFVGAWSTYFAKAVTASQLTDIYAYLYLPDTPTAVRDKIAAELQADGIANADGILFAAGKTAKDLKSGLIYANIDVPLKARAEARVAEIRNQLNAQAAIDAKAAAQAETQTTQANAAAAQARSLATTQRARATDLDNTADAAEAAAAALDPADLSAASAKARTDAVKARTLADDAEDKARDLEAKASAAETLARDAASKSGALAVQAANSGQAAPGAGSKVDPDEVASRAPVPAAPNGRPLDTPPDP